VPAMWSATWRDGRSAFGRQLSRPGYFLKSQREPPRASGWRD
jgi:hypothetical protein